MSLRIQSPFCGSSSQWRRLTVLSVRGSWRLSRPTRAGASGSSKRRPLSGPCNMSKVSTLSSGCPASLSILHQVLHLLKDYVIVPQKCSLGLFQCRNRRIIACDGGGLGALGLGQLGLAVQL